jgi:hypothetical protein
VVIYTVSCYFQIICWVLGEYGTSDGKHPASYIIGKLCDVAEAHPTDDTVRVCFFSVAYLSLIHCAGPFLSFML